MIKRKKNKRRSTEEVDALKARILEAKKSLKRGAVTSFISRFPAYTTYQKSSRVRQVFSLLIVDEEITEKFELMAEERNTEVEKGNIRN